MCAKNLIEYEIKKTTKMSTLIGNDNICYNLNIGFVTKCEVQGSMRPIMFLCVKHIFTNGGKCKDETQ
jgi:hypothetical protein